MLSQTSVNCDGGGTFHVYTASRNMHRHAGCTKISAIRTEQLAWQTVNLTAAKLNVHAVLAKQNKPNNS